MAGATGTVGSLQRVPSLIILGGLAALMATMLSFAYLEQVQSGVKLDCAIAELLLRAEGTTKQVNEAKLTQRDLFDSVYVRLNE
ncbi:hypothetical protein WJX84_002411, partial [Apatococcus fuscideae]